MSVFKDNHEKPAENRVKNPKKVYSAKQAHKKWGSSYRRGEGKKSRLGALTNKYEAALNEVKVDSSDINLEASIKLETLPVAFNINGAKDNPNDFSISLMVTEDGNTLFTQESQEADSDMSSEIFGILKQDFKTLADNLDRDIKNILSKNGLVKKAM